MVDAVENIPGRLSIDEIIDGGYIKTLKEIAMEMGRTPYFLRAEILRGRLIATKMGGSFFVRHDHLALYCERCKRVVIDE